MELQESYAEFQSFGAEVIAISVDNQENAASMVARYNLQYPVLYDESYSVTRSWGIFNLLDDGVSAPATYVFNADGHLIAYRIAENIGDRPHADEVLAVLSANQ